MAKKTLSFLVGIGISSAWWSLTVWLDDSKQRWVLPAVATIAFALIVIGTIVWHWND